MESFLVRPISACPFTKYSNLHHPKQTFFRSLNIMKNKGGWRYVKNAGDAIYCCTFVEWTQYVIGLGRYMFLIFGSIFDI